MSYNQPESVSDAQRNRFACARPAQAFELSFW